MIRKFLSRFFSNYPKIFYALKKIDLVLHYYLGFQFETDFLYFDSIRKRYPEITIVDVGANIGQSALGFARLFPDALIYSFEANPDLEKYLKFCKAIIGNQFKYFMVGLSNLEQKKSLFIPRRGKVLIYGEASVSRDALNDPAVTQRIGVYEIEQRIVRLKVFDSLNIKPDIVKIDVQGHELSVLLGMKEVIEQYMPIFIIERSLNDSSIQDFLSDMGYSFLVPCAKDKVLVPYSPGTITLNMFCIPSQADGRRGIVQALLQCRLK